MLKIIIILSSKDEYLVYQKLFAGLLSTGRYKLVIISGVIMTPGEILKEMRGEVSNESFSLFLISNDYAQKIGYQSYVGQINFISLDKGVTVEMIKDRFAKILNH